MEKTYQEILLRSFEERKSINSSYSLRAFARDLKIQPSHLSEMLAQKKGLSLVFAKRIATRLRMPRQVKVDFFNMVEAQDARSAIVRQKAKQKILNYQTSIEKELDHIAFDIIKDWHHFALRAYVVTQGKNFSLARAAKYFRLPQATLAEALDRLRKMGLVKGTKHIKTDDSVVFAPKGVPQHAKRLHHLQLIERAQHAYLEQPFDSRDYMSSILAIDPSKMDEAKSLIRKFHTDITKVLAPSGAKLEEVYCLSSQLFSLKGPPS